MTTVRIFYVNEGVAECNRAAIEQGLLTDGDREEKTEESSCGVPPMGKLSTCDG